MRAFAFFADGFEEVEALTVVDGLIRAGIEVVKVSVMETLRVVSSHRVPVECDCLVTEVQGQKADLVFLPGGMPGSTNLAQSWPVNELVVQHAQGALVAAICAAPAVVLGPLGLLKGRRATCFPGCESYAPDIPFSKEGVVRDGNIVTGKSAGWAFDLGLRLVEMLYGPEDAEKVRNAIYYRQ